MATTTPISNTPRAEAPQLSKAATVLDKKPSGPVDTLEVAKSDAKSTTSKSKSWLSSCWESFLNFLKCIFCCGCSKKDSSKEASSTAASSTNSTTKAKIEKERAEAEKLKGLEREIYALKWIKKAVFETGDEQDFLKAEAYANFPEDKKSGSIKEFKENCSLKRIEKEIKVMKNFQAFAHSVLSPKTTNEEVMKLWKDDVERYEFCEFVLRYAQKYDLDSHEDFVTRKAIHDYVFSTAANRQDIDAKCQEYIKSALMKKACQRLLDLGSMAKQEDKI